VVFICIRGRRLEISTKGQYCTLTESPVFL
jgi:hypothetical protein